MEDVYCYTDEDLDKVKNKIKGSKIFQEVKEKLTIIPVHHVSEVLKIALKD